MLHHTGRMNYITCYVWEIQAKSPINLITGELLNNTVRQLPQEYRYMIIYDIESDARFHEIYLAVSNEIIWSKHVTQNHW